LPDRYAPKIGEVLEYRRLSNHPVLQSAANQKKCLRTDTEFK